MGEYLELVPKEAQGEALPQPKRTLHPETPTTNKTVQLAHAGLDELPASSQPSVGGQSSVSRPALAPAEPASELPLAVGPKVKVLRPAQVENWQSSSFDLLTGLMVRDVTDTIPGQVFDELFRQTPVSRQHPDPRRRRGT